MFSSTHGVCSAAAAVPRQKGLARDWHQTGQALADRLATGVGGANVRAPRPSANDGCSIPSVPTPRRIPGDALVSAQSAHAAVGDAALLDGCRVVPDGSNLLLADGRNPPQRRDPAGPLPPSMRRFRAPQWRPPSRPRPLSNSETIVVKSYRPPSVERPTPESCH